MVLEALPEGMIVADIEQKIQFINSAACNLLKIDGIATLDTPLKNLPGGQELMNAEQVKDHYRLVNFYGASYGIQVPLPKPYEAKWRNRLEDGLYIQYRSLPIWDSEQQPMGIVLTVSDATDAYTASELLFDLFHDMLTPLSMIAGFAELLQTRSIPPEEQQQFLQIINSKAQFLIQMRQTYAEAAQKRLQNDTANAS